MLSALFRVKSTTSNIVKCTCLYRVICYLNPSYGYVISVTYEYDICHICLFVPQGSQRDGPKSSSPQFTGWIMALYGHFKNMECHIYMNMTYFICVTTTSYKNNTMRGPKTSQNHEMIMRDALVEGSENFDNLAFFNMCWRRTVHGPLEFCLHRNVIAATGNKSETFGSATERASRWYTSADT